jgi:CRP/FNR family transcriptional regulator, cyclic AMP receptor protein
MGLEGVVAEVELFRNMKTEHIALVAGCASNVVYPAGTFAARAGSHADQFWAIREGSMALELWQPGRGAITIDTVDLGGVVGYSWLLEPYQLQFDIHALTTTRALLFDGQCLRQKCAKDPELGYELYSRFARLMADRIQALTLQLLDVYGDHAVGQE